MIAQIPSLIFSVCYLFILSFISPSNIVESDQVQYQHISSSTSVVSKPVKKRRKKSAIPSKHQNKHVKKKDHIKKIDTWDIKVSSREQAVVTTLSGNKLLNIQGPSMQVLFVSVEHFPVSAAFVKDKIKEWKGDEKSLKVQKLKDRSIFSFRVQDHVHWFSSEGGYLLATVDQLNQKQYLSLLKRVRSRGKSK